MQTECPQISIKFPNSLTNNRDSPTVTQGGTRISMDANVLDLNFKPWTPQTIKQPSRHLINLGETALHHSNAD